LGTREDLLYDQGKPQKTCLIWPVTGIFGFILQPVIP